MTKKKKQKQEKEVDNNEFVHFHFNFHFHLIDWLQFNYTIFAEMRSSFHSISLSTLYDKMRKKSVPANNFI